MLQFLKRNSEAEQTLNKARLMDPNNLDFAYAIADHYIKTNKFSEAKKIAEEIKLKFPQSGVAVQILNYLNNQ